MFRICASEYIKVILTIMDIWLFGLIVIGAIDPKQWHNKPDYNKIGRN